MTSTPEITEYLTIYSANNFVKGRCRLGHGTLPWTIRKIANHFK
jgi:hypothetical protein